MFTGLLAYDWLRILIWFDHMGLRVATLVNLSFLGGDRADEAAARFVGHHGRTRAIPDGIRRFGTWAPLLIPFYIPRGAEWDKAWTGAETLARGGAPMPDAVKTLGFAYAASGCRDRRGLRRGVCQGARQDRDRRRHGSMARRSNSRDGRIATPSTTARWASRFSATGEARLSSWARSVAASQSISFAGRSIRLQARGHFFYVSEEGEAPWSIGFEPARRAGDYRIEEPGFNRLAIVNALNGIEARMEIAPDPEGAILSWRIRLENKSDRQRRLRLTSFCEIAGHETGAYAKDLDFAGMHVETVFVRPLNAILARNRLLRSARADRGETSFFAVKPGLARELVGYEDSRIRFIGEGSLLKANRLRAVALAQARRRRQALALRSGGELHARGDACARRDGRGGVHRRPLRQRGVGERIDREAPRPCASARAGAAEAPLRNARRRAFARAAFALAVQLLGGRQGAEPHPSHAAPVGACDGERARHGDDGLQRRRDFLRLRQRPPERPLRLSL